MERVILRTTDEAAELAALPATDFADVVEDFLPVILFETLVPTLRLTELIAAPTAAVAIDFTKASPPFFFDFFSPVSSCLRDAFRRRC